jgi:hypothetical protein
VVFSFLLGYERVTNHESYWQGSGWTGYIHDKETKLDNWNWNIKGMYSSNVGVLNFTAKVHTKSGAVTLNLP